MTLLALYMKGLWHGSVICPISEWVGPGGLHVIGLPWQPLALIRLTNAASQLPYGSGETKGEGLPLHFISFISSI
jgi:hypothetical protein